MEKFAKILLEGIQNRIGKNHQYPSIGLDENRQLKIVFEPSTPEQRIKDFERGLQNFCDKNKLDKSAFYLKSDSQPYKSFTILFNPEQLHHLLIKQSSTYHDHYFSGSILSLLNPHQPIFKPDMLCFGPVDLESNHFHHGGRILLDTISIQVKNYFQQQFQLPTENLDFIAHNTDLMIPIIEKYLGISFDKFEKKLYSILHQQQIFSPCQIEPLTEEAKLIYMENYSLSLEELEQYASLEIPIEIFLSDYIEILKNKFDMLQKEYEHFIQNRDPTQSINHLHSELILYEQCINHLQNNEELKAYQKSIHQLDPCLKHISLFLTWLDIPHPEIKLRLVDMIAELPYLYMIPSVKAEQLTDLYKQVLNGHSNALQELKTIESSLFQEKEKIIENIKSIEHHIMLPMSVHLTSNTTEHGFFSNQTSTQILNQHRLTMACEAPSQIPQIIKQIKNEIYGLSQEYHQEELSRSKNIAEIKVQIDKMEELITPPRFILSH